MNIKRYCIVVILFFVSCQSKGFYFEIDIDDNHVISKLSRDYEILRETPYMLFWIHPESKQIVSVFQKREKTMCANCRRTVAYRELQVFIFDIQKEGIQKRLLLKSQSLTAETIHDMFYLSAIYRKGDFYVFSLEKKYIKKWEQVFVPLMKVLY